MSEAQLEERISEIETKFSKQIDELGSQVAKLCEQVSVSTPGEESPWWERFVGIY